VASMRTVVVLPAPFLEAGGLDGEITGHVSSFAD
jgi:hypothetical protein